MENEVMVNEGMEVMDEAMETVEQTEARDHSGAIGFALGSLVTLGVIAGVNKAKEMWANHKAKKAAKAEEGNVVIDIENSEDENNNK